MGNEECMVKKIREFILDNKLYYKPYARKLFYMTHSDYEYTKAEGGYLTEKDYLRWEELYEKDPEARLIKVKYPSGAEPVPDEDALSIPKARKVFDDKAKPRPAKKKP